jgi:RNA polymerase sigma factor (sigma-70 family)
MAKAPIGVVLRTIRRLVEPAGGPDVADAELLEHFLARGEEAAFAALLRRHGPMVLSVCRRVLRHQQDAEDAFQATFLVLARQASHIRKRESVSSWLYGVAYRVARKAQALRERRPVGRRGAVDTRGDDPGIEVAWREVLGVVDEEVQRLAAKYRAPIVLCYLEGKTHDEAAAQLGWPPGTVKSRLARARDLLRDRLTARGLASPAGLVATVLAASTTSASPPAGLLVATSAAALPFSGGKEAAGVVSAPVARLVGEVLKATAPGRLGLLSALVLAVGSLSAGAGVLARFAAADGRPGEERQAEPVPAAAGAGRQGPAGGTSPRTDRSGDPLPPGAVARLGSVRFRLRQASGFTVSADGKTVAAAADGVVLWETATGKTLSRFVGPEPVHSVARSPDGKVLAAGELGGVRIWDVGTGRELGRLPVTHLGMYPGTRLVFSPDGKILATGHQLGASPLPVTVWDVAARKELWRHDGGDGGTWYPVTFTPDGKTLVVGQLRGTRIVWLDARTGQQRRLLELPRPGPGPGVVLSVDGNTLATGAGGEQTVRLWDMATGKARALPGCRAGEVPRAFSHDGKVLASTGADKTLRLWDVATGKEVGRTRGAPGLAVCLTILPDRRTVAFSLWNQYVLRFWDLAEDRELHPPGGHLGHVAALAFAPGGGGLFSAGSDSTIRSWEASTARERGQPVVHPHDLWYLELAADGKLLASGSANTAVIWIRDPASGQEICRLEGLGKTQCLAFSPTDKVLVSGWLGGISEKPPYGLQWWDTATGKELRRSASPSCPYAVAFSTDGRLLALVDQSNLHLWEAATGRESIWIALPEGTFVHRLTFSPDGRMLAAVGSRRVGDQETELITLWETATGKERLSLKGPAGRAYCVTFSPGGRVLATGGLDRKVHLWDAATGREVRSFAGHQAGVSALAFAPDRMTLASGSFDTTVLLWGVPPPPDGREPRVASLRREDWEGAWRALADGDAAGAYRAIVSLGATPSCVPFLRERLRPVVPPETGRIDRLLADLDSDRFAARARASRELEALGELARPALRKALAGEPSLEARRRMGGLLEQLGRPVVDPEMLRGLRAVEVLEHLATQEARHLLQVLGKGAGEARVTREARASLERLARRPPLP